MTPGVLALLLGGYLVGSIPFGLLTGRAVKGIDLRQYGSGNIGFSNALRVLGWRPAAVVFVGDALKGAIPVVVGQALLKAWNVPRADLWILLVALAPILGHSFSVFLRLRGGRAVTTTLGVLLGVCWQAGAIALGVWLVVVAITRYISAGSICAAISVPTYMFLSGKSQEWLILWCAVALLVILRHLSNIKRLVKGTEVKIGERVEV
jgi:glycerol-3-phosphate acyltransferase PlsY